MGVLITWIPDDTTISQTIVLCNSSRSVEEHDLKLNNTSLIQIAELYKANFISQFNRYNDRTVFSFKVRRDATWALTPAPFSCAEDAFWHAALHVGPDGITAPDVALRGTGKLQMALSGPSNYSNKLTFNNAAKNSIDMIEWMGIAITFEYKFTCASISNGFV